MPQASIRWIGSTRNSRPSTRRDCCRAPLAHQGPQGPHVEIAGRECVNFGANDYLGLAADPRVAAAAAQAIAAEGWGSGASPLVAGRGTEHLRLERALAAFERTEAALLFSSGYAANLTAVTALAARGDAIFADEMNHASLIDGCRLSRAAVHVYPHGDWRKLEELLRAAPPVRRRLIVTDALFSMDGDFAPLAELADLAARTGPCSWSTKHTPPASSAPRDAAWLSIWA